MPRRNTGERHRPQDKNCKSAQDFTVAPAAALSYLRQSERQEKFVEQGWIVADFRDLTEEQARWLRRVLQVRPKRGGLDVFTIPDEIHEALMKKGFIRWVHGQVEISLEGIRAISRYRPPEPDLPSSIA